MGLLFLSLLAQNLQRYVYTGGFFVFSHGDTLQTDRVVLVVDGKIKGNISHPSIRSVKVEKNRLIIYIKKGKYLREGELKKYISGKIKRIEVRRKLKRGRKE